MVIVLVGVFFSPMTALAVGNHPMAGCGLAYMLFSKDSNSKGTQILAGTTNGIYGTQTFGITSGTSGCTEDGALAFEREVEVYAAINLTNLSEEMAKGEGEYVSAFASLLGTSKENRPKLIKFFQERYEVLFPSQDTNSIEMLDNLNVELQNRPDLIS